MTRPPSVGSIKHTDQVVLLLLGMMVMLMMALMSKWNRVEDLTEH